jgi:hypothetical protein
MLTEPVAVMLLVAEALEDLGIPYLVGGSMASAVHGVYRATADADLVAEMRPDHVAPLVARLGPDFYVDDEDIRDAIARRRSFNVVHLDTMFKVDIFVSRDRPFDQAQFARRVPQVVATDPERTAYLASAEDTVLAKLDWYRRGGGVSDRQWGDIIGVLRTQGGALDVAYLRHWATDLNLTDVLERALAEAGQAER